MKRLVQELIKQKGLDTFATIHPSASIYEALKTIEIAGSSAALVVENQKLRGIFSEKDFARAAVRKGIQLWANVDSVMTSKVYIVDPTFTLEECLQIMSKVHIRHLPVLEGFRPVALISMRDIVEALVGDRDAVIQELTTYITGTRITDLNLGEKPLREVAPLQLSTQNQEAV